MLALPAPRQMPFASGEGAETNILLREEKVRTLEEALEREYSALSAKGQELDERENMIAEKERMAGAAHCTAALGKQPAAPAAVEGQDAAAAAAGDTPAPAAAQSKPAALAAAGGQAAVAAAAGSRPAELAESLKKAIQARKKRRGPCPQKNRRGSRRPRKRGRA